MKRRPVAHQSTWTEIPYNKCVYANSAISSAVVVGDGPSVSAVYIIITIFIVSPPLRFLYSPNDISSRPCYDAQRAADAKFEIFDPPPSRRRQCLCHHTTAETDTLVKNDNNYTDKDIVCYVICCTPAAVGSGSIGHTKFRSDNINRTIMIT